MSAKRSLNVGDVILAAFKICGDRWKELLKITVQTVFPAALFGTLLLATYMPDAFLDAMGNQLTPAEADAALRAVPSSEWVNLIVAAIVYALISSIANVIALNACIHVSIQHHEGRASDGSALRAGFSTMWPMLWLLFISGLAVFAGLLLCLVPGVWLFVVWSVAPVVLIREGLRGTKALGRSRGLVRGNGWLVFAVLVLEFATLIVLQTITGIIPGILLPSAAEANSFAVFFTLSMGGAIAGLFGVALHAAVSTELYLSLNTLQQPPTNTGQLAPIAPPPPPPPPL
jgi:hypothetical protein